jgi:hypothetical protein
MTMTNSHRVTNPNQRFAAALKRLLLLIAIAMFFPSAAIAGNQSSFVSIGGYRASDKITSKAVGTALTAAHVKYDLLISYGATIVVEEKDVEVALAVLRKLRDKEEIRLNLFEMKSSKASR